MLRGMKRFLLLALTLLTFPVLAQTVRSMSTGGTVVETPACGASPCAMTPTSTKILNASNTRFQCLLQNTGAVPLFCAHGSGVANTQHQFILKASSATSTGDGTSYTCNQGPGTYRGSIYCLSYATSTDAWIDVSAVGY